MSTEYTDCNNNSESLESLLRQLIRVKDDGTLVLSVEGSNLFETEIEIIAPGNSGTDENGNWRWIIENTSNNLLLQKRKGGSWVTVGTDYY